MNFNVIEKQEYFKNINLKINNEKLFNDGIYSYRTIDFEFEIEDGYCVFTDKPIFSIIETQLTLQTNKMLIKEIENHINKLVDNLIYNVKLKIEQDIVDNIFNQ